MKPGRFEYFRPTDLDEALELKAYFGDDASLLAGGQSLIPVLNFRLSRPQVLIDLASIDGLRAIEQDVDSLQMGAMVRQLTAEKDDLVAKQCPLLVKALPHVAHPAVRNRGTIGGTVAHADPSAEVPAVLTALGGWVGAQSTRGYRRIQAQDFFTFQLSNSLEPDEMVVDVYFPRHADRTGTAFLEFGRRNGDFALAGVGASLSAGDDGMVLDARIAVCGVAATPVRPSAAEDLLRGAQAGKATWQACASEVVASIDVVDETQASIEYRRDLLRGLVVQALARAWRELGESHE